MKQLRHFSSISASLHLIPPVTRDDLRAAKTTSSGTAYVHLMRQRGSPTAVPVLVFQVDSGYPMGGSRVWRQDQRTVCAGIRLCILSSISAAVTRVAFGPSASAI